MWFKNLHLFRVHDQQLLSIEQMAVILDEHRAKPLGNSDARRLGWTAPAGRLGDGQLIHEAQSHRLLSALRQERLLPSSVIAEEVSNQVAEIEANECRKVTKKEKSVLKEQVIEELLPQAFVRSQKIDVWWDVERQLIGINTSSRSRAEDVLDLLRYTLGSLKVTPLATRDLPTRVMTHWLQHGGDRPAQLTLGDSTVLQSKGDDSVLRGRRVDLDSDDMQQLLDNGRQAMQLGIMIDGQLSCTLRDDLSITALRFADAVIEEADAADDGDDPVARLEADFTIMAACLRASIDQLIEWMGGEAEKS
jgi:recombination associated protein RdgC